MTLRSWATALRQRLLSTTEPPSHHDLPETFSISPDALRLALLEYASAHEAAMRWTGYAGLAFSLWGSLAVTDFSFTHPKFGLDGRQWQLIFVVAASLATFRALTALAKYLRKPSVDALIAQVLSRGEVAQEFRAICLLKRRSSSHDYRILVYRDALWDCFLLPHYNMANTSLRDINDPNLRDFIACEIGVSPDWVTIERTEGTELRSRKHSEFWRQGTIYRFTFFIVKLNRGAGFPSHLSDREFVHNGRDFSWLTLSEMEADPNTKNRNLDMTRHIADRATQLLRQPPDSL
ncbi:hypothetical protein [Streptomyces iranensis]|uniref:hypothetical protein n=1 Tax=Streptomyces iranensis TaxID=576784 RepID=UPI0039B7215E